MARLQAIGFEATTIQRLMGGNIAGRLAYPVTHSNSQ
jgi:hypothetical protein